MEQRFSQGDMVKVVGFNRPCQVLSVRTRNRVFAGRMDQEGVKEDLSESHYTVQIDGSSACRFEPESKLRLIPTPELEQERALAAPLPTGPAQHISGQAAGEAALRARRAKMLADRERLKQEVEDAKLAAEVDAMKAELAALKGE